MRRSILVVCALLAGTTLGCDRIKLAIDKIKNRNKPPATAAQDTTKRAAPAAPAAAGPAAKTTPGAGKPAPATGAKATAPTPAPATAARPTPPPPTRPAPEPVPSRPIVADEPYNSPDTGTIAPGMSAKDVEALWGPAAAVRRAGEFTYLLYPNGCEHTCGTADLVILQNDKVTDAVLRWKGHGYSGQSSSPRALPPGRSQVTP